MEILPDLSRRQLLLAGGVTVIGGMLPPVALCADDGVELTPFDPNRPARKAPPGLPNRIGAVMPAPGGIYQIIHDSMKKGADDFGVEFVSAWGNSTADSVVEQGNLILNRGVALLYSFLVSLEAQQPLVRRALDAGVDVTFDSGYPCTTQINGSQVAAGAKQARAAIDWINANIREKARVVYLNNAKLNFLIPRDVAVRDTFQKAGIKLVADETPAAYTPEAGNATMSTLLQRYPDINVVVGPFNVMGGAVAAMEAAGKTGGDIYMSVGNPNDAELALIESGGILRTGLVFPFEPMCYSLAKLALDWQQGKSVPRGITVPGGNVLINSTAGVKQYKADVSDLKALYKSDRFKIYVGYWGNTSYEDREDVWDRPWQQTNV
jgi:ABC-type sugar transport system substrate-binding protein